MAEAPSGGAVPRVAAARALAAILGGQSLSEVLPVATVPVRDRALLAELLFGTCRWFHRLDFYLGRLLQRPLKPRDVDVRTLLLVGLYQLTELRVLELQPPGRRAMTASDFLNARRVDGVTLG